MKKILITGTSGFIGGALYRELSDSYQVSTFNESDIIFNWKERLSDLISEVSCVIHIGAISSTTEANINKVMELNYEFSKFVFSQASENDISVIFSSSAAIYGPHEGEDCPKNIYGWSKKLCEDYGLLVLKKFIALRYFNVYGPGEQHKGKSASVAYQAFLHKKSSGEPFPLFSGGPQRDFIYIDDVVSANIFALECIDTLKKGVYDVGTGVESPFEAVLNELEGKYFYPAELKAPPWYQYLTLADEGKFLPGWKPKYSLQEGIKKYKTFL